MTQETTEEFAFRLTQAMDGHPLAPPTPFGRQKWLRDKLKLETGLDVSPNTIHKWVNGMSRPREDSMRKLAKILAVDEVWLTIGRKPVVDDVALDEGARAATDATMMLAAMVSMHGGRYTFPGEGDTGVSLFIDLGKGRFPVTVVTPTVAGKAVSFMIPEPVKNNRIVSVALGEWAPGGPATARVEIIDLTDAERTNMGGFSVVQGVLDDEGKLRCVSGRDLDVMPALAHLAA